MIIFTKRFDCRPKSSTKNRNLNNIVSVHFEIHGCYGIKLEISSGFVWGSIPSSMTTVMTSGYTVVAIETVRDIDEVPNAIKKSIFIHKIARSNIG